MLAALVLKNIETQRVLVLLMIKYHLKKKKKRMTMAHKMKMLLKLINWFQIKEIAIVIKLETRMIKSFQLSILTENIIKIIYSWYTKNLLLFKPTFNLLHYYSQLYMSIKKTTLLVTMNYGEDIFLPLVFSLVIYSSCYLFKYLLKYIE